MEQVTAIISNIAAVRLQKPLFRGRRHNKTLKREKKNNFSPRTVLISAATLWSCCCCCCFLYQQCSVALSKRKWMDLCRNQHTRACFCVWKRACCWVKWCLDYLSVIITHVWLFCRLHFVKQIACVPSHSSGSSGKADQHEMQALKNMQARKKKKTFSGMTCLMFECLMLEWNNGIGSKKKFQKEKVSSNDMWKPERFPLGHSGISCSLIILTAAFIWSPLDSVTSSTRPSNRIKLETGNMEIVFINCHLNVCFVPAKPTQAGTASESVPGMCWYGAHHPGCVSSRGFGNCCLAWRNVGHLFTGTGLTE